MNSLFEMIINAFYFFFLQSNCPTLTRHTTFFLSERGNSFKNIAHLFWFESIMEIPLSKMTSNIEIKMNEGKKISEPRYVTYFFCNVFVYEVLLIFLNTLVSNSTHVSSNGNSVKINHILMHIIIWMSWSMNFLRPTFFRYIFMFK